MFSPTDNVRHQAVKRPSLLRIGDFSSRGTLAALSVFLGTKRSAYTESLRSGGDYSGGTCLLREQVQFVTLEVRNGVMSGFGKTGLYEGRHPFLRDPAALGDAFEQSQGELRAR